jgi:hypothetical protein
MDTVSLASLALQLPACLRDLSGCPATKIPPEIHRTPPVEIQQRFCQGKYAVRAYYKAAEGVVIDDTFDLANREFARPVLLHELVHHVQPVEGTLQKITSESHRGYARPARGLCNPEPPSVRRARRTLSTPMQGRFAAMVDATANWLIQSRPGKGAFA